MQIEAKFYIKPRHKIDCNDWKELRSEKIGHEESLDSFFPGAGIHFKQIRDWAILFAEGNAGKIKAIYKDQEDISENVPFPIVMEEGVILELYTENKSVDLKLLPVTVDQESERKD